MRSKYWVEVKHIVQALFDSQKHEWSLRESKNPGGNLEDLPPDIQTRRVIFGGRTRWTPLNETKLDALFSSEVLVEFQPERLVLPLPPFPTQQTEFVPVLSMSYNPNTECMEMRVGMYRLDGNSQPCGFGFRLEAPTSICKGKSASTMHDFYHVQLVKNIENYAPPLQMPDWLPEYQPSFCVRAENPVEALLSLVLSMYGLMYFKQFMGKVKRHIQDSHITLIRSLLT